MVNSLQSSLSKIYYLCADISETMIQQAVDDQLGNINQAIHMAATEAELAPKRTHRPKPYWNPDLSRLRDRKRFWWRLWIENGRPRDGVIHETYKWVKKQFRKLSRQCVNNIQQQKFGKLGSFLNTHKMSSFWNEIKRLRRGKVSSDLKADDFQSFFQEVMTDTGKRSTDQMNDQSKVECYADKCMDKIHRKQISSDRVSKLIDNLPGGKSPGIDGVTSEHLKNGKSPRLCDLLANLYSVMLSRSCVPAVFTTGVIIPLLKKPTLNPNIPKHYRPVTISSIHTKVVECLLIPSYDVCNTQFGFREGRGTSMACNLFTDIICHCKSHQSPLFVASLVAEKCFDCLSCFFIC